MVLRRLNFTDEQGKVVSCGGDLQVDMVHMANMCHRF